MKLISPLQVKIISYDNKPREKLIRFDENVNGSLTKLSFYFWSIHLEILEHSKGLRNFLTLEIMIIVNIMIMW